MFNVNVKYIKVKKKKKVLFHWPMFDNFFSNEYYYYNYEYYKELSFHIQEL